MSSHASSSTATEVESKALATERGIASKTSNNAKLEAAISSAELYMQALRLTRSPIDRKRLDAKTKELIAKAESFKSKQDESESKSSSSYRGDLKYPFSTRKLRTRENIILLEGSKLNGAIFKPWTEKPDLKEFDLDKSQHQYVDDFDLPLSEAQLKSFAGWRRPRDALAMLQLRQDGEIIPSEPTMVMMKKIDLVQDITSDCSVVASLCVGTARAEKGHQKILGSIVHPYLYDKDQTAMSPNGKYVLRLYFNGCWRRVDIDDRLPTSSSSRVLHVVDRSHPGLLWPALVEKAYLKVRGGYDFPGSNSGTDLAVLCGWIPQQVFLHDEDIEIIGLWDELISAFCNGNILVTIGTGKLGKNEQRQLGLAAEHDYAVLDMKETRGIREMLIKNPWADGEVWKGAIRRKPNPGHEADEDNSRMPEIEDEQMLPGTFWMDFNSVFQYFENMYINWNPGLFSHRQDLHLTWNIPDHAPVPNVFIENPQFSVSASQTGELWLLLNRHFRTGDYTSANHGKNGYISLYLYDRKGIRVLSSEGARIRGPFVDSPNTLLRFSAYANEPYTVVVASQDLPSGRHNFTLSAFSMSPSVLDDAQLKYTAPSSVNAIWTRSTAGGNSDSPRYLQNPQFKLNARNSTNIALVLRLADSSSERLDKTSIHVKILIASSDGKRITKLRPRDIVAHSGDYRRGSAVIETSLTNGSYSVICSTFEQNQFAKFQLDLYSSSEKLQLSPIPSESSGRLSITTEPAVFTGDVTKVVASLSISRMTKAIFIASQLRGSGPSLFKLSLQKGQGPYSIPLVSSATDGIEFGSISSGLRIEDTDLNANMHDPKSGGLWLVLEKPSQSSIQIDESQVLQVEILAEERVGIGSWTAVESYD